jgi:signal transduction histidine kinase
MVAVKLDGDPIWYNYFFLLPATDFKLVFMNAITDAVVALILTVPLIWLVGHVMRPFGTLALNAERLGRGEAVTSIDQGGSADVRSTVDAFNRMGNRIALSRDYQAAMLRSLAHDLKGPLGNAVRVAKSLSDQSSGSRIMKSLRSAQDSIEAITGFARATRRDGDLTLVDLPSLIEALVDEQLDAGHAGTARIDAPVTLQGRRNAISRALQNILENAGKYSTSFEVSLTRDDRHAIIQVDDDGPGIDADKLELVFRPFERLSTNTPGSGLGLSIAKAIIVDHGGTIELQNREPRGLRATVTLPLDPGQT